MNRYPSSAVSPQVRTTGAHRTARKSQSSVIVRSAMVGGAAVCIGLLAEVNLPDASALSILLPAGNGNATQINILEGNIFRPQFGLGGNGNNVSNNRTIGGIIFGGSDPTGDSHVIALGGAKGNGNVTQINIASYNIFNPQASIFGNNTSVNTTVSNVSAGNGNGQATTNANAGSGALGLFGPALGAGNTGQISLLSGNIFNPQFTLFGSNTSANTAVTNVSAVNGNGSPTTTTGGGIFGGAFNPITGSGNTTQIAGAAGNIINPQYSLLGNNASNNLALTNQSFFNGNFSPTDTTGGGLGAFLVGITGSGNSTQFAGLVSNIVNPQGTFGGVNQSANEAGSNNADTNGNHSPNDVSSTGGGPFLSGNNTIFGQLGSGVATQFGNGNGNIVNEQFRLFTAFTNPPQQPAPVVQQVETGQSRQQQAELTNAQVGALEEDGGTDAGAGSDAGNTVLSGTGAPITPTGPRTLSPLGQRVADAVNNVSNTVKGALGLNKPKSTQDSSSNDNTAPNG